MTHLDEPRYGRFYFLEAFGVVRTLYLNDRREVTKKSFRWDYRTIANLVIKTGVSND